MLQKWQAWLGQQVAQRAAGGARQVERSKALEKLVASGVPLQIRGRVWLLLSGALDKMQQAPPEHSYGAMLQHTQRAIGEPLPGVALSEAQAELRECLKGIEKDTHRTFAKHTEFAQGEHGKARPNHSVLLSASARS